MNGLEYFSILHIPEVIRSCIPCALPIILTYLLAPSLLLDGFPFSNNENNNNYHNIQIETSIHKPAPA